MRGARRLPTGPRLFVYSLAWLLATYLACCLSRAYLDSANPFARMPAEQRRRAHDPLLLVLGELFALHAIPPSLPSLLVCLAPLLILLRAMLARQQGLLLVRRTCWLLGLGFLAQIPFTLMTRLPSPDPDCNASPDPSILVYSLELALGFKHSCGDVVFSSYTVLFVSAALVWILNPCFGPSLQLGVDLLVSLYALVGVLSQIGSQSHYTLDCVLSAYFTALSWGLYHLALRHRSPGIPGVVWLVRKLDFDDSCEYQTIDATDYF